MRLIPSDRSFNDWNINDSLRWHWYTNCDGPIENKDCQTAGYAVCPRTKVFCMLYLTSIFCALCCFYAG